MFIYILVYNNLHRIAVLKAKHIQCVASIATAPMHDVKNRIKFPQLYYIIFDPL